MRNFVHLHNHTEYSLLDGMLRIAGKGPSQFLKTLAENKVPAMAMTDHGNMYGALEFYKNMKEVGVKPIIGCEFYVTPFKYNVIDKNHSSVNHLTVLSSNLEGYHNLMELNSLAWVDGFYYHPRIDFDLLEKYKGGLIALSGCLKGALAQSALNNKFEDTCKLALKYQDMLGKGNYYIEIMDHGIKEEKEVIKTLLEVSKKTGIPLVATNDCHYEKREDSLAHDIHMCIATGKTLNDENRLKMTQQELYFKNPEEMAKLFDYAPQALDSTLEIAEKCNLEFKQEGFILPQFDIPAQFNTQEEYLKFLCLEGLKKKLKTDDIPQDYLGRLTYELGIISKMGFACYFLIVADFISYARSRHIPVGPGRGSGAGSLVAYSMDITRVDPIKNNLLFERFLNPDRISMPDLDIDFSDAGREEVIEYMRRKYGGKNVAQIITFGTMKAKLALKDTARVMGFSVADSNRLTKLIPDDANTKLSSVIETVKEVREEMERDPKVKQLFDFAQKIEGLKRHTGVHAAGILVTKDEISKYTPLAKGARDVITTQFEGETLVNLGLLKIDFLGLRTLTVISDTLKLIKQLRGVTIDIDNIPLDDKKAYELLCSAQTTCIFQLESGGMRDLVKRLVPTQFSDISALVALYRPGPMQSGMLDSFVKRKHGLEKVSVDHPLMEPVLKETYGTMIYQEQIMEIAKALSGFTPGEADTLRKAMGKKKIDIMEKFRAKFVEGAARNGAKERLSTKIFDQMASFAEYGFNKSHSVAYAMVAYQTAYLKANYPVEFMCSALTNEIGHNAIGSQDRENKIATYLEEARRMGFEILPCDVQKSEETFTVELTPQGKDAIRFGLLAIKNIGGEACKSIVEQRKKDGPYKNLQDLCMRIDTSQANKKALESLAMAGALDGLYDAPPKLARALALSEVEQMLECVNSIKKEKESCDGGLFGDALFDINSSVVKPENGGKEVKPFTETEMLNYERDVLGIYFSGHPMAKYSRHLKLIAKCSISDLYEKGIKGRVEIAGIITRIKKRQNKNTKKNWAQLTLEDENQSITLNAFSGTWDRISGSLAVNTLVVASGDVRGDDMSARPELILNSVEPVLSAVSRRARKFIVTIPPNAKEEQLVYLNSLFNAARGVSEVFFKVKENDGNTLIRTNKRVLLNENLINFIESSFGANAWDFE